MPLLLVCVVLFFGAAQFYHWSNGLESLPFPVLLIAGAALAIVSNLSHQSNSGSSLQGTAAQPPFPASQSASSVSPASVPTLPPDIRPATELYPKTEPQLPQFEQPIEQPIVAPPEKSISFTLKPASDRPEEC